MCSRLSGDFLKVRQTDALRQFNFISASWNWYGIKKMPACGWVSAEWREGRRLPRPVLWREQFPIPDRGLALYPPKMGKLLRRSLPHPHSQSPLVHRHLAQVSNISRVQPRCPKTVFINAFQWIWWLSGIATTPDKVLPPLIVWDGCDVCLMWFCLLFLFLLGETCKKWQVTSQNFNCMPIFITHCIAFSSYWFLAVESLCVMLLVLHTFRPSILYLHQFIWKPLYSTLKCQRWYDIQSAFKMENIILI